MERQNGNENKGKVEPEIEHLALEKAIASWAKEIDTKELDKCLEPGTYPISAAFLVNIEGAIKRQENYQAKPTCKIPLLTTLALVLEKCGATGNATKNMLITCMKEAMELGEEIGEKLQERMKDLDEAMAVVSEITSKLPAKQCKGALRVILETTVERVERIEQPAVEKESAITMVA